MYIDAIEIYHIGLPWKRPQPSPRGFAARLETVLVRMCGEGACGWGEASPGNAPSESGEWAAGAFAVLRDWLAPAVVGQSVGSGQDLGELLACFAQNRFAKGALDAAWWDLQAKQKNLPLHALLGAKRSEVDATPTLDRMESTADFLDQLGSLLDAGFPRVKLMIRAGWSVEMLRTVRQEFSGATLQGDCAGALGLDRMDMFYRFDDFFLEALEQPLAADDLVGHAMLQESIRTPICLDEGIRSLLQAEIALDLKSCRKVNLHAPRVGGLTEALRILAACNEVEVPCHGGARPQSGIGAHTDLALACCISASEPADFFDAMLLADDLVEPLVPHKNATTDRMTLPAGRGAGIGMEPDAAKLNDFTLATSTIRP